MHGKVHTTVDITLKGAYAWVILKRKEERGFRFKRNTCMKAFCCYQ